MADQLKGFDKHDRNVYQEMTDKYDSAKYDKALELNEKLLEKYPEHPGKSQITSHWNDLGFYKLFNTLFLF